MVLFAIGPNHRIGRRVHAGAEGEILFRRLGQRQVNSRKSMPAGHTREHSSQPTQRPARWKARVSCQAKLPFSVAEVLMATGRFLSAMHCRQ